VRTDLKLVYVTTSRPLDVVPDAGKAAISAPLVSRVPDWTGCHQSGLQSKTPVQSTSPVHTPD